MSIALRVINKQKNTKDVKEKITYAICNQRMEPVLVFSHYDSMIGHMKRQKEIHGVLPQGTPCNITTTIETEKLEWLPELE